MAAIALAASLAFAGCRSDRENNGGTPTPVPPPPPGTASCPGDGLTVCDMKLDMSTEHPMPMDPVVLTNVVVTTGTMTVSKSMDVVTIAGFFVQDQTTSQTLNGQYSGILVTYKPEELGGQVPGLFDIVNITGVFDVFTREGFEGQKQVQAAAIENSGMKATLQPVEIERADLIATGGEKAAPYEGVLVKINETTITNTEPMPNAMPIFGAFIVDQSLIVSGTMYEYRNPVVNEVFTSIAGVLRLGTSPFEAGQYMLTPRFQADLVPKNAAAVVTSIKAIQDVNDPGHPLEGCVNPTGSETIGKCATADITNAVVTAVGQYVSTRLRAAYIQDDNIRDGRFAGVKVVYNPDTVGFIPTVGMRVNVMGEVIDYFRGTQIQYPTFVQNGTTMTELEPIVVAPADIARNSVPESNPYEGVLVRVAPATVTTPCLEDSRQRDHGNWVVEGVVYIGSGFQYGYNGDLRPSSVMCLTPEQEPTGECDCEAKSRPNDMRMQGDMFTSISGVMDYSFNELQLQPRSADDLVR